MKVAKIICWAMVAMPTLRGERLHDGTTLATETTGVVETEYTALIASDECGGGTNENDQFRAQCYDAFKTKTEGIANRSLMAKYVADVVNHEGYEIQDDVALEAFVRYFDNECEGTPTYDRLVAGLHAAADENCNGNNWLTLATVAEGSTSLGQLRDAVLSTSADKNVLRDARVAMHNVYKDRRRANPYDVDKRKTGIKDFTGQCLAEAGLSIDKDSLDKFADDINALEDAEQKYAKFRTELGAFLKEPDREVKDASGTALDDAGIDGKLALIDMNGKTFNDVKGSVPQMAMFIYHLASVELEMHILNYGDLLGMAPWYTTTTGCEHYGSNTAVDLVAELGRCAEIPTDAHPVDYRCGGWIQSDAAPTVT